MSRAHPPSAGGPEPAVPAGFVDRPADEHTDPDAVRDAVLACPDVAALSGGLFGEVASYLPGRRVTGIRIAADDIEVHVVARYGRPFAELADDLDRRLATLLGKRRLVLVVDDVVLPGEPEPEPEPAYEERTERADRSVAGRVPGGADDGAEAR